MSFKLIAIRPLKGCNNKFLKNLEENTVYKFYNDYIFKHEDEDVTKDVIDIEYKSTIPENLYGDKINISAIVGKNGSGKSSLVELMYAAIYNLSIEHEIITVFDFRRLVDGYKHLNIEKEFFHLVNNKIFESENEYSEFKRKTYAEFSKIKNEHPFKDDISSFFNRWEYYFNHYIIYSVEDLFLEIFLEILNENGVAEIVRIKKDINDKSNFKFSKLNKSEWEDFQFIDKSMFYSLVINYSLYGLNSEEIGDWVERVFHKNDGYQTPIVINPYRDQGKIDINSENELVRDRLLANMFINKELEKLTQSSKVEKLIIEHTGVSNFETLVDRIFFDRGQNHLPQFKKAIISFFYSSKNINIDDIPKRENFEDNIINDYCLVYIFEKIKKIVRNYKIYGAFSSIENDTFLNNKNIDIIKKLIEALSLDNSHITYKIRQAVNFIMLNQIEEDLIYYYFSKTELAPKKEFEFSKYSHTIRDRSEKYNIPLINLLPPSIFKIDFKFHGGNKFSALSSGEKQLIFSTNSLLYHLINLNSTIENDFPLKYPYINIILDEIELYAHPDMQRKYINDLLKGIKKIDTSNIKAINILFITHSPFILSDIPKQNILYLKTEKRIRNNEEIQLAIPQTIKNKNSFGANITDLLADSFFIDEGLMGDFAKDKINKVIELLNRSQVSENEKDYSKKLIEIIDEPLIKTKLRQKYYKKFPEEFDNKRQIEILNDQAKKLGFELKKV